MANKVYKRILEDIAVELADEFDKNFSDGGFFGKTWQPKKNGEPSHLQKSGALRRSFSTKVTDNSITFSSSVPYAEIHNSDGKTGKNLATTMPQRQFMGWHPSLQKGVEKIVEDNINEHLNDLTKLFNEK